MVSFVLMIQGLEASSASFFNPVSDHNLKFSLAEPAPEPAAEPVEEPEKSEEKAAPTPKPAPTPAEAKSKPTPKPKGTPKAKTPKAKAAAPAPAAEGDGRVKRERKTVQHYEVEKPKEEEPIMMEGKGTKLRDIPNGEYILEN